MLARVGARCEALHSAGFPGPGPARLTSETPLSASAAIALGRMAVIHGDLWWHNAPQIAAEVLRGVVWAKERCDAERRSRSGQASRLVS